jgi:hypothetical protein
MAMWAVKSAQKEVPDHALSFLKRHEEEEREHLKIFEKLTGEKANEKLTPPKLPRQWHALAVHLYGYEALGLELARILAGIRPDLAHILVDEEGHVKFFEDEVRIILQSDRGPANGAREYARAWFRRLPRTVERYLRDDGLAPHREQLRERLLKAVAERFTSIGLNDPLPCP